MSKSTAAVTTILLIHPDLALLEKCQAVLEKNGFSVLVANDGSQGIEKLYQHRPSLVVSNILLSEINGYQICRLAKNDPAVRNIPFILISDYSDQSDKMQKFWGIRAGADLFLKSADLDLKLVQQVRILLEMYGQDVKLGLRPPLEEPGPAGSVEMLTRLNQILDKSLIESTLMIEFRNLVDLTYEPTLLNHMLTSFLEDILDYDAMGIFYNDRSKTPRLLTIHIPHGQSIPAVQLQAMKAAFFSNLPENYQAHPLFQMQELEIIGQTESVSPEQTEPEETSALLEQFKTVYPRYFYDKGELIGAVVLYARQKTDYPKIFPMALVEDELSLLMKVRHVFSQAELLAVTDSLTGLMNYAQFMTVLEREFKSSKRYGNAMSLAIIDIDNFKEYNARWGYLQGDEVLRLVAIEAEKTFRAVDVVARLGGEELAVIFPKTDELSSVLALDRFKENVANLAGTLSPVSVSIGLSPISDEITDVSSMLSRARQRVEQAASRHSI